MEKGYRLRSIPFAFEIYFYQQALAVKSSISLGFFFVCFMSIKPKAAFFSLACCISVHCVHYTAIGPVVAANI